jgi:membrane protein YdbS with pleckstrin-like domain
MTRAGMSERASQHVYRGVWGVLSRVFKVPQSPPDLPRLTGEFFLTFKPARGFVHYLRFKIVWGLLISFILFILGAGILMITDPSTGLLTALLVIALEVVAGFLGLLAIQLRYDTTWYVLNDRSMRLRRGIFVIKETTITFENIQNVSIKQGPLQRWFKISTIVVETAGGGGKMNEGAETASHSGIIEGIENANEIRDLLMTRMSQSRRSGLGDDEPHDPGREEHAAMLGTQHRERLREIRDLLCRL